MTRAGRPGRSPSQLQHRSRQFHSDDHQCTGISGLTESRSGSATTGCNPRRPRPRGQRRRPAPPGRGMALGTFGPHTGASIDERGAIARRLPTSTIRTMPSPGPTVEVADEIKDSRHILFRMSNAIPNPLTVAIAPLAESAKSRAKGRRAPSPCRGTHRSGARPHQGPPDTGPSSPGPASLRINPLRERPQRGKRHRPSA